MLVTLGSIIYFKRIDRKESTKMLADAVGCSVSFIRGIERGSQYPSKDIACKILKALGVEYVDVDPFTLRIEDHLFTFTFTKKGYGGKKFSVGHKELDVEELENIIVNLSLLSKWHKLEADGSIDLDTEIFHLRAAVDINLAVQKFRKLKSMV